MLPSSAAFVPITAVPRLLRPASAFSGRSIPAQSNKCFHSTLSPPATRTRAARACAKKDEQTQPDATPSSGGSLPERPKAPEQTFFGLRLQTNGDVLKFGIVATVVPFVIKELIQYALTTFWPSSSSNPDLLAGQITTGFVSVFALLAWISTYAFRVGTKQMTYAQQLREYEDAVIQKRYEELTEEELAALTDELNDEA